VGDTVEPSVGADLIDEHGVTPNPVDPPGTAEAAAITLGRRRARPAGSRRRVRQAALVVGVAALAGGGGVLVGAKIKSPADAADARAAPAASWITVPVERRKLVSTLVVSGETRYVEPTAVRLAGAVGTSGGERQVITRIPELGAAIAEGGVMFEVSGRPVFALRGDLPMYRQLAPGSTGPDVLQLETALETLGFPPGTVDEIYDAGTEAALDAFYQSKGYESEGASESERKALADARKAVADAEDAVRKAKLDLSRGTTTVSDSQRIAAQQQAEQARAETTTVRQEADRNNAQADQATLTSTALRDNARATRDTQQALVAAASAAGAVNPATGEAYTAVEIAELQQQLNAAEQDLISAEQALSQAVADQQRIGEVGSAAVKRADDALTLARAQLADLGKPGDTSALTEAVAGAEQQVVDATAALSQLEAEIGTIVPAGEVVFLPTLPTSITLLNAQLGAQPPADLIAQVSSTDTEIVGFVSKPDAELITTGTPVTVNLPDIGIETTGVLIDVRPPTPVTNTNGGDVGFPQQTSSDTSGRLEIVVAADDTSQIRDYIGLRARISVTVSSTDDEVLAVPVAALSVGPDGTSRVEVEVEKARGTRPGRSELVEVTVGLAAQGYAEVVPVAGANLQVGDRVIVGTDTGQRQNRRQSTTRDTTGSG
jgi:hypothetical protein